MGEKYFIRTDGRSHGVPRECELTQPAGLITCQGSLGAGLMAS